MKTEIMSLRAEIRRLKKTLSDTTPPLEVILKRRGFTIYKKEPSDDLLVPSRRYSPVFFERLKKYSFRLFLRDVIRHQTFFTLKDVTRYATERVSSGYVDFLLKAGIAEEFKNGYRLRKRPLKSFGSTLEWFIAGLIKREFCSESVWGVKFKRPGVGGDYDLIAKFDSSILYMEVKSSPPKQICENEISAFLVRVDDLNPEIAVFLMDTELRMKDKIVPMFEACLQKRHTSAACIERIEKELFHIDGKIFIINSKDSITANIGTVFSFYWHGKAARMQKNEVTAEEVSKGFL